MNFVKVAVLGIFLVLPVFAHDEETPFDYLLRRFSGESLKYEESYPRKMPMEKLEGVWIGRCFDYMYPNVPLEHTIYFALGNNVARDEGPLLEKLDFNLETKVVLRERGSNNWSLVREARYFLYTFERSWLRAFAKINDDGEQDFLLMLSGMPLNGISYTPDENVDNVVSEIPLTEFINEHSRMCYLWRAPYKIRKH